MFTKRQIAGFMKARVRSSSIGGGTVANDAYNLENFGITDAEYQAMRRVIVDAFGLMAGSASPAELRRALSR